MTMTAAGDCTGKLLLKPLPVHGFVLAGGQSSRMGEDKALLQLGGRALVEIAVDRLRGFCGAVSLAGNRADLARFAPVVPEARLGVGPGAGLEAGLAAATFPWVLFTPVDVPLVPAGLLREWVEAVLERAGDGCQASSLSLGDERQPSFALLRSRARAEVSAALDGGERRLAQLLRAAACGPGGRDLWWAEVFSFKAARGMPAADVAAWFSNLNTPAEFASAAKTLRGAVEGAPKQAGEETVREGLR